jgi:hypothetical protein
MACDVLWFAKQTDFKSPHAALRQKENCFCSSSRVSNLFTHGHIAAAITKPQSHLIEVPLLVLEIQP